MLLTILFVFCLFHKIIFSYITKYINEPPTKIMMTRLEAVDQMYSLIYDRWLFNSVTLDLGWWNCQLKKDVQLGSCELSFIWGEMRTAAQDAASQIALRDCSKATVRKNQYIKFWWGGSSIPWSTQFTKDFLLFMRIWCHHEGI